MTSKRTSLIPTIESLSLVKAVATPMKHTPSTTAERLNDAVQDLKKVDFHTENKGERLTLRLCASDRHSMDAIAASLGLSVGDYLVQLHRMAAKRLEIETLR